ncbi:hypothetical protein [Pseudolysinimonas yzui]|uniref:DUF998 domain-containing protein n=1 Tax=Pseudolysinimonas yzui TaxID=2708254 RepID=A0A8J3GRM1_9MICO|nr:hypothetical protein [Pseudolysinimonas yzui]GHF21860.1 hypothetical protein GCM10011600_23610 [Pseudolysinimonas yzui]
MRRALLVTVGALFVLYPALRPWQDETLADGAAAAMGSPLWVASHSLAMLGFILLPAVPIVFAWHEKRGRRTLVSAAIVLWLGVGLVLPYYGAEAFALNAVATLGGTDLIAVSDSIRFGPVQGLSFLAGLLLVAAGAVLTAAGLAKSHPWWLGVAFAAGFVLFGPQFAGPPAVRVAHGVLVGIGCLLLAGARSGEGRDDLALEQLDA